VFLALREMRRALLRFGLLVASIALLVFLILFQQTLQQGLITSIVGAIERQSAPVLVYSVDGLRNLEGSVITPDLEARIRAVDGVGGAARIGQGTFTIDTVDGTATTAVVGYEDERLGGPTTLTAGRLPEGVGEVVALDSAEDLGFGLGDSVVVEPGGQELEIVGQAAAIGLQASPTLFTTYETLERIVTTANPDAAGILPAAIGVAPADGVTVDGLVERIDDAVDDAEALARTDAAAHTPGIEQIQQAFQVIFLLYGLVVPLVAGLFFLILTLQKAPGLTLLRAVGLRPAVLVRSLLLQVAIVLVAGIALGVVLYAPVSTMRLGSLPLEFQVGAVVVWAVVLFVLGLASASVSARRVLAIDPIEATTGQGVSA
jgi:putative ABC transport system permease protein